MSILDLSKNSQLRRWPSILIYEPYIWYIPLHCNPIQRCRRTRAGKGLQLFYRPKIFENVFLPRMAWSFNRQSRFYAVNNSVVLASLFFSRTNSVVLCCVALIMVITRSTCHKNSLLTTEFLSKSELFLSHSIKREVYHHLHLIGLVSSPCQRVQYAVTRTQQGT